MSNKPKSGIKQLTFGDLSNDYKNVCVPIDEALLIVIDNHLASQFESDPNVNPFVCAITGPEDEVREVLKQYENNDRYEVMFEPAEATGSDQGVTAPDASTSEHKKHTPPFPTERTVYPQDNATDMLRFDSLDSVLTFLYSLFHAEGTFSSEFSVYNPSPSEPTGDFIFPPDIFLWDEHDFLPSLDYPEFLKHCKSLVTDKKVPAIAVVAGLDRRGIVRISAQALFCSAPVQNAVIISVSGGTAGKNQKALHEILEKANTLYNELI